MRFTRRCSSEAFGDCEVIIGHHLTFQLPGQEPIEIPSADTLMFDGDIMRRIFGSESQAIIIMRHLASLPCEDRDERLAEVFDRVKI